jgi:hypothetical protein
MVLFGFRFRAAVQALYFTAQRFTNRKSNRC